MINETLHERLSVLENMIGVQRDSTVVGNESFNGYMHGMLNGMIYAHSIVSNSPPEYHVGDRRRWHKNKIRHKGRR